MVFYQGRYQTIINACWETVAWSPCVITSMDCSYLTHNCSINKFLVRRQKINAWGTRNTTVPILRCVLGWHWPSSHPAVRLYIYISIYRLGYIFFVCAMYVSLWLRTLHTWLGWLPTQFGFTILHLGKPCFRLSMCEKSSSWNRHIVKIDNVTNDKHTNMHWFHCCRV